MRASNCKLCGGVADASFSNFGYCTRSVMIRCNDCKISYSDERDLNDGNNGFDNYVISTWNRMHKKVVK